MHSPSLRVFPCFMPHKTASLLQQKSTTSRVRMQSVRPRTASCVSLFQVRWMAGDGVGWIASFQRPTSAMAASWLRMSWPVIARPSLRASWMNSSMNRSGAKRVTSTVGSNCTRASWRMRSIPFQSWNRKRVLGRRRARSVWIFSRYLGAVLLPPTNAAVSTGARSAGFSMMVSPG